MNRSNFLFFARNIFNAVPMHFSRYMMLLMKLTMIIRRMMMIYTKIIRRMMILI